MEEAGLLLMGKLTALLAQYKEKVNHGLESENERLRAMLSMGADDTCSAMTAESNSAALAATNVPVAAAASEGAGPVDVSLEPHPHDEKNGRCTPRVEVSLDDSYDGSGSDSVPAKDAGAREWNKARVKRERSKESRTKMCVAEHEASSLEVVQRSEAELVEQLGPGAVVGIPSEVQALMCSRGCHMSYGAASALTNRLKRRVRGGCAKHRRRTRLLEVEDDVSGWFIAGCGAGVPSAAE